MTFRYTCFVIAHPSGRDRGEAVTGAEVVPGPAHRRRDFGTFQTDSKDLIAVLLRHQLFSSALRRAQQIGRGGRL